MENTTKHALISGGTAGVGLSIVKALAAQNYKIIFIGQNLEKGNSIASELNANSNQTHTFVKLDLSDLKAVKAFTQSVLESHSSLDLLVNVAGIISPKQQLTSTGLDKTFAIGYLSTYILSTELIPLLKNGNQSRIVNVGGGLNIINTSKIDFENLNFTKNYSGLRTAFATIHAKTVLTQILAEKLINDNIDVNSFHPGSVKSDLTRNMPKILQFLAKIAAVVMAKESTNGIFVCSDESITGVSGKLFINKKPKNLKFDFNYREKLWKATEEIIDSI